jgi:Spy/CpxP family protein refolding chaperone
MKLTNIITGLSLVWLTACGSTTTTPSTAPAGTAAAELASAEAEEHEGREEHHGRLPLFGVKLTEAQQAQAKTIWQDLRRKSSDVEVAHQALRDFLANEVERGAIDAKLATEKQVAIVSAEKSHEADFQNAMVQFHALLTPEQKQQVAERIELGQAPDGRKSKHEGHEGKRGDHDAKREHGPKGPFAALNLTDAQKEKLKATLQGLRAAHTPHARPMLDEAARAALAAAVRKDKLTVADLPPRPAGANWQDHHIKVLSAMLPELTQDQRLVLAQQMREHKGMHHAK